MLILLWLKRFMYSIYWVTLNRLNQHSPLSDSFLLLCETHKKVTRKWCNTLCKTRSVITKMNVGGNKKFQLRWLRREVRAGLSAWCFGNLSGPTHLREVEESRLTEQDVSQEHGATRQHFNLVFTEMVTPQEFKKVSGNTLREIG